MEPVFEILAQIEQETIGEVRKPAEDKRSEFHYGRVHGMLFCLALIAERLREGLDEAARQQEARERNF